MEEVTEDMERHGEMRFQDLVGLGLLGTFIATAAWLAKAIMQKYQILRRARIFIFGAQDRIPQDKFHEKQCPICLNNMNGQVLSNCSHAFCRNISLRASAIN